MDPVNTDINPVTTALPVLDFSSTFSSIGQSAIDNYPSFVAGVKSTVGFMVGVSIPLSLLLIIGIIYCVENLKMIRKKEHDIYDLKVEDAYETTEKADPNLARRWESVQRHIESTNQNDWRQAIMEADIILDELLNKMEYHGESIGEKLKRVEKSDFNTLNEAWEAHKFRNQIAHEGSAVNVNQYEAKRIINLYKKVFEEFYYI
jgi:hypothetical protein